MFETDKPTNYEEVYNGLVLRLADADFGHAEKYLGAVQKDGILSIPFLGYKYKVGPDGVEALDGSPDDFKIRIVMVHYLLHAGNSSLTGNWVAYRDFKDGAFFSSSFSSSVESNISQRFGGRMAHLEKAARYLKASNLEADFSGDLCLFFPTLPQVPLALIYYDSDEDFPASAKVPYDSSANRWLDMECLAVIGMILAEQLALAGS